MCIVPVQGDCGFGCQVAEDPGAGERDTNHRLRYCGETEVVFTLGDARSFSGLTSTFPPLGSMLNFDADVNKTTARHQCENCFKRKYETTQNVLALCLSFANIFAMMRIVADESSRPKLGIEFYA